MTNELNVCVCVCVCVCVEIIIIHTLKVNIVIKEDLLHSGLLHFKWQQLTCPTCIFIGSPPGSEGVWVT